MAALFVAIVWFCGGLLAAPFTYRRWRVFHAKRFPALEAEGEGAGWAVAMAIVGLLMGPTSLVLTLYVTHGYGWRAA